MYDKINTKYSLLAIKKKSQNSDWLLLGRVYAKFLLSASLEGWEWLMGGDGNDRASAFVLEGDVEASGGGAVAHRAGLGGSAACGGGVAFGAEAEVAAGENHNRRRRLPARAACRWTYPVRVDVGRFGVLGRRVAALRLPLGGGGLGLLELGLEGGGGCLVGPGLGLPRQRLRL